MPSYMAGNAMKKPRGMVSGTIWIRKDVWPNEIEAAHPSRRTELVSKWDGEWVRVKITELRPPVKRKGGKK